MELKPGYKQTEVGVIPEEWECEALVSRIAITHGFAFQSQHFNSHGPYRLTTPGHFHEEGGFRDIGEKQKYYTGPVPNGFLLQPDDLILVMTEQADGLLGSAAIVPKTGLYLHNQRLGRVKAVSPTINLDFLYYVFNSSSYRSQVRETAAGTKVKHTSPAKLLEIKVPLPSLTEQIAIATVLSDADALISALDKLIVKKRNIKQAAMQQLLTGKKRLPDFSGDWKRLNIAENSILKARIGWQGLTTAEYLEDGDYYLVTGTDFQNGRINWESCCFVDEGRYLQDRHIQLKLRDILLTKDGTIGKVGYVDHLLVPATLNSGVFVIRPKNYAYHPLFLFYILTSRVFDEFLLKLQAGSTISHLYQKDFINFSFIAPELEEQQTIASVLSDMDTELTALEAKRDKIRALKQGMMQELLTGRIRLV